jgi:hypothetical protein
MPRDENSAEWMLRLEFQKREMDFPGMAWRIRVRAPHWKNRADKVSDEQRIRPIEKHFETRHGRKEMKSDLSRFRICERPQNSIQKRMSTLSSG